MSSSKSGMTQKEYLQKYLNKPTKKRPKSFNSRSRKNLRIIDDEDYHVKSNRDNYYAEDDEDAPVIAAIIDERPREISQMERYHMSGNWRQLDGASPPLAIPRIEESSRSRKFSASRKRKEDRKRDISTDNFVSSFKGSNNSRYRRDDSLLRDSERYRDSVSPSRDLQVDEERRYRHNRQADSSRYREDVRNGGDWQNLPTERYRRESPSMKRYRDDRMPLEDLRFPSEPETYKRRDAMPEHRLYRREESPKRNRHPRETSVEIEPPFKERKRDFGFLIRRPPDQMREKRSESPKQYEDRLREDYDRNGRDYRRRQSDELIDGRSNSRQYEEKSDQRRRRRISPDRYSKIEDKRGMETSQESRVHSKKHDQRSRDERSPGKLSHSKKHDDRSWEKPSPDQYSHSRRHEEKRCSPDPPSRLHKHDKKRREISPDKISHSNEFDERRRDNNSDRLVRSHKHEPGRKETSREDSFQSSKYEKRRRDEDSVDRNSRSNKYDEKRKVEINSDQTSRLGRREEKSHKGNSDSPPQPDKHDKRHREKVNPNLPSRSNKHKHGQRNVSPDSPSYSQKHDGKHGAEVIPDRISRSSKNETEPSPKPHSRKDKHREKHVKESDDRKRREDNSSPVAIKRRKVSSDCEEDRRRKKDKHERDSSTSKRHRDTDNEPGEKSSKSSKYGLVNSKSKKFETEEKLTDDVSGMNKNTATIYRDKKTGKIRDFEAEKIDKIEKRRKEDEKMKQFHEWGKGLKQVEDEKEKKASDLYEMSKPLARYADDEDLDAHLKQKEIESLDPMLEYIQAKRKKKETGGGKVTKSIYKGSYPPNRFGIRPGHRWDGRDRSNGYEQKWFAKQSDKKAMEEDAYKWCSEDM